MYDSLCQSNNNPNVDTCSTGSNQRAASPNPVTMKQMSLNSSTTPTNSNTSPISKSPSPGSFQKTAENSTPLINISDTTSKKQNNTFSLKRTGSSSSRVSSGSELSPTSVPYLSPPTTSIPTYINSVQISYEERLEFDVTHFFVLGSPLGLILASRKLSNENRENTLLAYLLFFFT